MDPLPSVVCKRLQRSRCRLECWVGCMANWKAW